MMSRIAVLDDYQGVALDMADWSQVSAQAEVVVFDDHLSDADAVADRLGGSMSSAPCGSARPFPAVSSLNCRI